MQEALEKQEKEKKKEEEKQQRAEERHKKAEDKQKIAQERQNKYFELKNSWGCRPNSNYLPASIMLGGSITHVQNTHQLHSVQTH